MRLPSSYTYSLGLWMRLRGNSSGKKPSADAAENIAPSPLPTWMSGFFSEYLDPNAVTTKPIHLASKDASPPVCSKPKLPATCSQKPSDSKPGTSKKDDDQSLHFESMNLEEFAEFFPDDALNPLQRPTFWPHAPEDQLTHEDEVRRKGGGSSSH